MIRSDGEVIWLLDTGGMVERDVDGQAVDVPGDPVRRHGGRGGESAPRGRRARPARGARGRAGDPLGRDDPPRDGGRALHVHRPAGPRHPRVHARGAHGRVARTSLGWCIRTIVLASRDLLRALRGDGRLGGHLPRPPARRRDPLAPFVRPADLARRRGTGALARGRRRRDGDASVDATRRRRSARRTSDRRRATSRSRRRSGARRQHAGRARAGRGGASRGSPRCRRRAGGSP